MKFGEYNHHVPVMDKAIQKTNQWLKEICDHTGLDDYHKAYSLLRAVLHSLRDRLTVEEAAHLSSQLPTLIRGIFYDSWTPARMPSRERSEEDFLSRVRKNLGSGYDEDLDLRWITKEIFHVLERHISDGELRDIKGSLPKEIRDLFAA